MSYKMERGAFPIVMHTNAVVIHTDDCEYATGECAPVTREQILTSAYVMRRLEREEEVMILCLACIPRALPAEDAS